MVTCGHSKLQLYLLEINSEPAVELTGPRLMWVLEDLFMSIARIVVEPHLNQVEQVEGYKPSEGKQHLLKCLEVGVRGEGGW